MALPAFLLPFGTLGLFLGLLVEDDSGGRGEGLADAGEEGDLRGRVFHNIYHHTQRGPTVEKKVKLFLRRLPRLAIPMQGLAWSGRDASEAPPFRARPLGGPWQADRLLLGGSEAGETVSEVGGLASEVERGGEAILGLHCVGLGLGEFEGEGLGLTAVGEGFAEDGEGVGGIHNDD